MEDANIESIQSHYKEIDDKELDYAEEVAANAVRGYSEISDDDVRELIPEVEIPNWRLLDILIASSDVIFS